MHIMQNATTDLCTKMFIIETLAVALLHHTFSKVVGVTDRDLSIIF